MASNNFRFRTDLVISQQVQDEQSIYIIKDATTGRFFRLKEPEHRIAQQLDGATSLDVIRQRVEEKFGAPLSQETLEQFVERLRRLGLLEAGIDSPYPDLPPQGGKGVRARPGLVGEGELLEGEGGEFGHLADRPRSGKRIRGNLLYLRFKAFDPDRLLNRLICKAGVFFTPYFFALSAALIVFAFGITIVNSEEIGRELLRLARVEAIPLAALTFLLVTTAHEFAHGLTCKRFGGEVREMGFMLIFFMPAFYCNVSDAWLFPEKSKRLWVTFAGGYFELFIWALATLTWRVTEPDFALNSAALVVMATSGIRTLFNLNPLIRLDGYYLLSDYLEIPNLRKRALSYLGAGMKRLWGSALQGMEEASARERRIYFTYGLLAGAYSFMLLGFIALSVGNFLIGQYQGAGFILFAGLLTTVFRNPLRKMFLNLSAPFRSGSGMIASLRRPIKLLILGAGVLAVLFLGRMELKVSGEFKVLPAQNSDIRAEVEGIIQEIRFDEGDLVQRGDLITRLSDRDHQAELRKIAAEINEKRAKLKMLKIGPRREEIEVTRKEADTAQTRREEAFKHYQEAGRMRIERLSKAQAALDKAKERVKYANERLAIFKALRERDFISLKDFQDAEENAAVRQRELEEAQAELKLVVADDLGELRKAHKVAEKEFEEKQGKLQLLLAGSRPEEIEASEAELSRLEGQNRYLEEQIQLLKVMSPISGLITTPKLKEKIGQHVKKGDLIAQVHELKTVRAEISVSEKDIGDVQVGHEVILKARSHPEKSFYGKVTSVATTAIKGDNGLPARTILVNTQIDNASLLLKPEMTGNAKMYSGERTIIDLVTRRLVRYIRVEFWSWW